MIQPKATHYRCIAMDHGGTYVNRPLRDTDTTFEPDTLPAIGTSGCRSCVAVYMKLSPTTCFCAHINASYFLKSYFDTKPDDVQLYDMRIVGELDGGYVRDEVIRLLEEESACMGWPPVEQIENVVLVCPSCGTPSLMRCQAASTSCKRCGRSSSDRMFLSIWIRKGLW
jgi:hypothetical protein